MEHYIAININELEPHVSKWINPKYKIELKKKLQKGMYTMIVTEKFRNLQNNII